jgi:hypothetical protein
MTCVGNINAETIELSCEQPELLSAMNEGYQLSIFFGVIIFVALILAAVWKH